MFGQLKSYFSHPSSYIIGVGFASLAFLMGTWATRLPQLKNSLELNDTQISIALLVYAIGGLIISPFSSYILDRYSTGLTSFLSLILQALFFILPFFAFDFKSFLISMFILGLSNGFLNVCINAAAASVEQYFNNKIMSSSHGMFSVGMILGSIMASFIAEAGVSPISHMGGVIIFLVIVNSLLLGHWKTIPNTNLKAPFFVFPKGSVRLYFLITFCIVLAELIILDWSPIYLRETLLSPAAISGFGLAGFSLTMALGRINGDALAASFGIKNLIIIGCVLGSIGLAIAAFTSAPWVAIIGFTICGIGLSATVPLIYSIAAKLQDITPGIGIASIATACILAGMASRPMTGMVADSYGMSTSLWIGTGFIIIAAGLSFLIKKE